MGPRLPQPRPSDLSDQHFRKKTRHFRALARKTMEELWEVDGTARTTEMVGLRDELTGRNGACCGFSSGLASAKLGSGSI